MLQINLTHSHSNRAHETRVMAESVCTENTQEKSGGYMETYGALKPIVEVRPS